MKFVQHKDGSCDLKFSFRERINLLIRGKVIFTPTNFKHFSNNFMKMLMDWHNNFDEETKKLTTESQTVDTE
tara:strand:- start:3224 stop:3439 length:216 start_codon:yes stop_codon:yes gene_type:complete